MSTPAARSRKTSSASSGPGKSRAGNPRAQRGLTCANCRSRKTRCDGAQPQCKTCEVYKDACRYEKPPPMSQIVAMAKRLQDAEQTIEELRRSLDERSLHDARTSFSNDQTILRVQEGDNDAIVDISHNGPSPPLAVRSPSKEPTPKEMLSELSLDENGKLCYYGVTSAVHVAPTLEPEFSGPEPYSAEPAKSDVRTLLTSKAIESRAWEEFAVGNAAIDNDIPRAVLSKTLRVHWTWVAPMFMWVYRPAFMRDMAENGKYYSPFLLTVLCAHASRFHDAKIGEALIGRARLLLGQEIQKPSSIPTVQALLQLSAREMAYGSISQAWLYSGMAFRMSTDLGLHHNHGKLLSLGQLSAEDMEIRRRLFWSCYFWDKAISLYLGRLPALIDPPYDPALELLDDFAEHELWSPYFGDDEDPSRVCERDYPPMQSHAISCFENSCRLAIILNDIILQLYSRRGSPDIDGSLRSIRDKLDDWRRKSPAHLKYNPDHLPQVCPPPHILTQNLLYYTTIILLHRPFYSEAIHRTACRQASDNIEKLLLLLEKTFGFTRLTYLMVYCIYTGASVIVPDAKAGDLAADGRLQTYLRALREGKTTCPLVDRSLDIITSSLNSKDPYTSPSSVEQNRADATAMPPSGDILMGRNYLPAFPYRDMQVDFSGDPQFVGMDVDPFSLLDSFPENHLDNVTGEWYMPS